MGRRLRGVGAIARRLEGEKEDPFTLELTLSKDVGRRLDAACQHVGLTKGEFVEALIARHLSGVRLAQVPTELLSLLGYTRSLRKSEAGEATQSDPGTDTPPAQAETSAGPPAPAEPAGGGDQGRKDPKRLREALEKRRAEKAA